MAWQAWLGQDWRRALAKPDISTYQRSRLTKHEKDRHATTKALSPSSLRCKPASNLCPLPAAVPTKHHGIFICVACGMAWHGQWQPWALLYVFSASAPLPWLMATQAVVDTFVPIPSMLAVSMQHITSTQPNSLPLFSEGVCL